jgi:hypothetical protein
MPPRYRKVCKVFQKETLDLDLPLAAGPRSKAASKFWAGLRVPVCQARGFGLGRSRANYLRTAGEEAAKTGAVSSTHQMGPPS